MQFISTQNILLLIIVGTVFTISLGINTIFTQIRDQFLHFRQQILASVVYVLCLVIILALLVSLYGRFVRGINLQKLIL